ncbi:ABC transporter permease [Hominifimenecus sp. rT4P-3]|uniref:ABC transporter permease n=1 Tax=Hominifimenecus sp. rT4P-3 TaxID=3242979 RepID=UPI003DA37F23
MSKEVREHQEPLIRMVKRASMEAKKAWLIRGIAFLCAIVTGGLLILALGHNPFEVYGSMIQGAFGKKLAIQETVKLTIPLLITGIGISLAFKMRFWNIGAEGQILAGAIAASSIAIYFDHLPHTIVLLLMGAAALLAGGIYGMIPAFFKAKWNTNETLFTLMMNYIALQFVIFLEHQASWQDSRSTFPKIRMFTDVARLPKIFGVHIGWIIALLIVVAAFLYLTKTKHGYEISVVGESANTARYAGMSVKRILIRTMFLSAALSGLVGFLQVSGSDGTLTETTAGGVGFTAITVAWLGHMNPFAMVVVSLFIAMLERGSNSIQTSHNIPASAADLLTGLILFFMLGCEFFINYQLIFRGSRKEEANG